jgi:hypothetical protein
MSKHLYLSGEEVKAGDRIRYHGEPGEVEFVVSEKTGDPHQDWYVDVFGGGIMLKVSPFGTMFLDQSDEDLELVARADA